ncbi:P63C domain-containing protein [Asinibacterium sp. OR53]|uniref:P63C domain-containing protein n=1 Tax=Asinibacterium sp. OR53 TaxID=925409 RepID=UPI0004B4A7FA|nr:P63C domain-containing protein [Asinibacterium sp. OR53]
MRKKTNNKVLEAKFGSADKPLIIGEIEIPCYVLEDGRRVIVQRGLYKALGVTQGGSRDKYKEYGGAARLVRFLDQNNLITLISTGLDVLLNPIVFSVNKTDHYGYEATLLQEIVRAVSKAYLRGELSERNQTIGQNAEILDDAFAKVGIIALVDEVTGYQELREKNALQEFLSKFIREERGIYIKTYPDEFFEAIFKMRNLNWSLANKGKKPQYIGHYINNYVYSRIAPNVLTELRTINPKDESGKRKAKHTQHIDIDYGHPMLKEHLKALTLFAKAAGYNWANWERMVNRALPKFESDGSQVQELDFDDI